MARQPRHQLSCQCCGLLFPAINLSAKWCSNACRQWAYHRRQRNAPETRQARGGLAPFAFEDHQVRVTTDEQGVPWFVAADLLAVLSLDRKAMERLDDDERGVSSIHTPGGPQSMTTVNEPGLYSLVLGSRKPEAKRFKRWVTHEVLPTIRRTGRYAIPTPPPTQQLTLPTPEPLIGETPAITDLVGSLRTIAADTAEAVQFELAILNTSTTPPLVRAVAQEFHATASRLRSLGVALAAVV
jgi:prophage antirepressor-like protein